MGNSFRVEISSSPWDVLLVLDLHPAPGQDDRVLLAVAQVQEHSGRTLCHWKRQKFTPQVHFWHQTHLNPRWKDFSFLLVSVFLIQVSCQHECEFCEINIPNSPQLICLNFKSSAGSGNMVLKLQNLTSCCCVKREGISHVVWKFK